MKVQDDWEVLDYDCLDEYEDYFILQKDEHDKMLSEHRSQYKMLSEHRSQYIHGVQWKLGMKLDSRSMEFNEINLFCLLMSRVNDYIIEFTNEGLNSKEFPPTSAPRAQEFHWLIVTLFCISYVS